MRGLSLFSLWLLLSVSALVVQVKAGDDIVVFANSLVNRNWFDKATRTMEDVKQFLNE